MTSPADIVAEYDRREAAAGGLPSPDCDPKAIVEEMAVDLGLDAEFVRETMITSWIGR